METMNQPQKCMRLLKKMELSTLFSVMPEAFQLVRFHKGELLVDPDKPMEHLLFLAEGEVHIYGLREDGSSFSVYMADQRTVLGDLEFICQTSLPFYTEASEEVLCVSLSAERYRKELEQDPAFLRFLLQSLASKFHLIFLIGNSSQPVEEKLLTFLREVQPDHRIHSIHSVTGKLQCSRSQLQRAVRKLCAEHVLEHTGKGKYRLIKL